jgi:hypothetical protein
VVNRGATEPVLMAKNQPMTEDRLREMLHIVRRNERSAAEGRERLRSAEERETRARAGSKLDSFM